jgi:transcriptional regulator with XRE-family HTH domain
VTLGQYIFRYRERTNTMQGELANRLGWPQSKLSRFETGAQEPYIGDFEHLMVATGATDQDRLEVLRSLRPRGR